MSDRGAGNGAMHDRGAWRPSGNKWLIAVIVTLAAFMEILDTTIVNVSLRYIAGCRRRVPPRSVMHHCGATPGFHH
jgi:hypothetical protein